MVADRAVFDRQAAMLEVDLAAAAGWPATADLSGAEQLAHRALEVADDHGMAIDRLDALDVLAVVAGRHGQAVEAARIWAARDAEAARLGLVATQVRPWAEGHRVEIMATVDAEMASAAAAEGASLEVAAAVAYVRRARGERGRPTFGWESLTPTESQVVELAASGLSNRLIGEQLFITAGTVKVHLGHVYAKLGVANRTELAAARGQRRSPVPGHHN